MRFLKLDTCLLLRNKSLTRNYYSSKILFFFFKFFLWIKWGIKLISSPKYGKWETSGQKEVWANGEKCQWKNEKSAGKKFTFFVISFFFFIFHSLLLDLFFSLREFPFIVFRWFTMSALKKNYAPYKHTHFFPFESIRFSIVAFFRFDDGALFFVNQVETNTDYSIEFRMFRVWFGFRHY